MSAETLCGKVTLPRRLNPIDSRYCSDERENGQSKAEVESVDVCVETHRNHFAIVLVRFAQDTVGARIGHETVVSERRQPSSYVVGSTMSRRANEHVDACEKT